MSAKEKGPDVSNASAVARSVTPLGRGALRPRTSGERRREVRRRILHPLPMGARPGEAGE